MSAWIDRLSVNVLIMFRFHPKLVWFMVLALHGGDILWSQDKLPAVAEGDVSYKKDVAPILEMHCLKCHGPQKQERSACGSKNVLVAGR